MSRKPAAKPSAKKTTEPTPVAKDDAKDGARNPRAALELLQRHAHMERLPAIFLLAYLRILGRTENAETARAAFLALRAQPWVWMAITRTDVVQFTRALGACGLELVTIAAMQGAMSAIDHELPVLAVPPAPPERAEEIPPPAG